MQDPIKQFEQWLNEEQKLNPDSIPMTLCTVSGEGRPSARVVLLKSFDENGFVFYTNLNSRKAGELKTTPYAALNFLWKNGQRQVRIEGYAEQVSDDEADAYFATRPRESQIGAWASQQSKKLPSREVLDAQYQSYKERFEGQEIPRPKYWSGFRVIPERIEFWIGHLFRLNERVMYYKEGEKWHSQLLYP